MGTELEGGEVMKRKIKTWDEKLDGYFIRFCRRAFKWSPARKAIREEAKVIVKGNDIEFQRCKKCGETCRRKQTMVDHIIPVAGPEGYSKSWDEIKRRMSFDDTTNLQVLCKKCHQPKSNKENRERRKLKENDKNDTMV